MERKPVVRGFPKRYGTALGMVLPLRRLATVRMQHATGDKVMADFNGEGEWYSATVQDVQQGDTECLYTLKYNGHKGHAGVTEDSVPPSRMQPYCEEYEVCDRVEANWQGKGRWYSGRIVARSGVCQDSVYSIRYDDGDYEEGRQPEYIRDLNSDAIRFVVDDPVLANYAGRGRYFPGTIGAVNEDECCYSIAYDDGDEEACVDRERLVRIAQGGECVDDAGNMCIQNFEANFNWKGYGKHYHGTVESCFSVIGNVQYDGYFSVLYDDGDTEEYVPSFRIKDCEGHICDPDNPRFARGDLMSANYKNRGTYYSGTVRAVNADVCTYTVYYCDGDREDDVMEKNIKPCGWGENVEVEVNWQGKGTYYPAQITSRNQNPFDVNCPDTYDVFYLDGSDDTEEDVRCPNIVG